MTDEQKIDELTAGFWDVVKELRAIILEKNKQIALLEARLDERRLILPQKPTLVPYAQEPTSGLAPAQYQACTCRICAAAFNREKGTKRRLCDACRKRSNQSIIAKAREARMALRAARAAGQAPPKPHLKTAQAEERLIEEIDARLAAQQVN